MENFTVADQVDLFKICITYKFNRYNYKLDMILGRKCNFRIVVFFSLICQIHLCCLFLHLVMKLSIALCLHRIISGPVVGTFYNKLCSLECFVT